MGVQANEATRFSLDHEGDCGIRQNHDQAVRIVGALGRERYGSGEMEGRDSRPACTIGACGAAGEQDLEHKCLTWKGLTSVVSFNVTFHPLPLAPTKGC